MARFELPSNTSVYDDQANFTARSWLQWFDRIHNLASALEDSGTTANRPKKMLWVGRFYFDTTLGKPIWLKGVNPTVWVDGSGVSV